MFISSKFHHWATRRRFLLSLELISENTVLIILRTFFRVLRAKIMKIHTETHNAAVTALIVRKLYLIRY